MTQFLESTKSDFNLEYKTYNCSFQEGVKDITENEGIQAILMGVREGDPHTEGAEHMHPSSSNWPAFMRIYPIFTWKHSDGAFSFILIAVLLVVLNSCVFCSVDVLEGM